MTVTARSRRVPLTGAALAAAALLAAGCSSSSSSSSAASASASSAAPAATSAPASSAPTAPSSAGATTPPPSGSGGTSTSTSTSASGHPACATSNLNVKVAGGQGAAGSVYTTIDFTNTGGAACTLYGYPGVSLVSSSGAQVGAAATRNKTHPPTQVTLSPGAKANAVVQIAFAGNFPASKCGPTAASSLRIYPPGQTRSVLLPYKTTGCSKSTTKQLSVTVVTAGAGDTGVH